MDEMNLEIISKLQMPCPNKDMVGSKNRTCSMFRIVFLDQCCPMETEASKFSMAM